jgi:RNA polymerase sigma factor (sigma-70 family)
MSRTTSLDIDKKELCALAEGLPFRIVDLPEFKKKMFVPEQIRQPRIYTSAEGSLQAVSRFLMERGTVEILTSNQVQLLFTEMHWCGHRIRLLSRKRYGTSKGSREAVVQARRLISQIEAAEEELFIANRRLVVSCVKPFFWIGPVWIGDFLQEGSRALSNAIRKFDISRGTPFYAYAQRAIQNRLRNYFRDHVRAGSIGIRPTREMTAIMDILNQCKEHERPEPDNATLAKLTGLDEDRVAKIRPFVRQWENMPAPPVSLDAMLGDSDANLYDFIEGVDGGAASHAAEKTEVWQAIAQLPERAGAIMKLRFIEGHTLEATGKKMKLTRARIKQIEDDSLKKIRHMLRRNEGL